MGEDTHINFVRAYTKAWSIFGFKILNFNYEESVAIYLGSLQKWTFFIVFFSICQCTEWVVTKLSKILGMPDNFGG